MQELVETRRELLAQIARGAKSWGLDSEDSRKSALDQKDDPNARGSATCKHGTKKMGENGFDIKMS